MMQASRPFVLSGGGTRGFAHLGVLKAFEENNVVPEAIAATSAGAIIAACICDGYRPDEVKKLFLDSKVGLSLQWSNWRSGILSLKKIEQFLQQTLRHEHLEELDIPLFITATNFITGNQHLFEKGRIITAVLAACSVPVLFNPVMINGVPFVDGGLSCNLPVQPLIGKYRNIIGVHVNPLSSYNPGDGITANLERVFHLAIRESVQKNKNYCDIFIEPDGLKRFGLLDFSHFDKIYNIGLDYTRNLLKSDTIASYSITNKPGEMKIPSSGDI